jgi:hypothetical protein
MSSRMGRKNKMETEAIVEQIKSLLSELRAKGISEEAIDSLLGQGADLRIVVDGRGYLLLPDCRNMKVRLTPMERTLYILLLRYPEGIPVDDLYMYYDELLKIYSSQTVYDDEETVKDAVGALVDDTRTTLYTNVSRIKKKLTDKLGARAAALCVGDMGGRIAVDGDENDVVFAHKEAVAVDPGAALFERDVV